jgi:Subtilase family
VHWTFKIREGAVTLNILEDMTAVRPAAGLLEAISPVVSLFSVLFGETVKDKVFEGLGGETALSHRRLFDSAGWHIVHPVEELARAAAEARGSYPGAAAVHHVYLTDSGGLMIGTGLATVQLPPDMTETQIAEALSSDQLEVVYKLGFAPNLFEVRLPVGRPYPEIVDELQANNNRYVFAEPSLLETITGRFKPSDVNLEKQWQHDKPPKFGINSLDAWEITRGNGAMRPVRIAIIDNGMQISHPELSAGIIGGGFFTATNEHPATPSFVPITPGMNSFPENNDHGTFCMGMAGARMNNNGPGCGSAPEADLIAIACAHDQVSTQTTLARSIECAVNPAKFHPEAKPAGGADVISCSLATNGVFKDVLKQAIDFATQSGRNGLGVPVFWAVDNDDGPIPSTDVCSDPAVIAVGRSDQQGQKFASSSGANLDFLAPGVNVFSTRSDSQFNFSDGTSFATPLAAGVAALVLSIHPEWTMNQVRGLLRESCDPMGTVAGHDEEFGFGRLNAATAVKKAKAALV